MLKWLQYALRYSTYPWSGEISRQYEKLQGGKVQVHLMSSGQDTIGGGDNRRNR